MSYTTHSVVLRKGDVVEESAGNCSGNFSPGGALYFFFFACRTEILTKRMTNGRDVYRGVNALRAKINLIERYSQRR